MTKANPLGIDFAAITQASDRRRANLEAIGLLIGNNAADIVKSIDEARATVEMLDIRWQELDQEGRDLLPAPVIKVLTTVRSDLVCLEGVLGARGVAGLRDLLPYALIPAPPAEVKVGTPSYYAEPPEFEPSGEYTIKVAIQSSMPCADISNDLNPAYSKNHVAGSFLVEAANRWRWITFTRHLSDDGDRIAERIAKSNFNITGKQAAAQQLKDELLEYSSNEFFSAIVDALDTAEVRFPAPEAGSMSGLEPMPKPILVPDPRVHTAEGNLSIEWINPERWPDYPDGIWIASRRGSDRGHGASPNEAYQNWESHLSKQ